MLVVVASKSSRSSGDANGFPTIVKAGLEFKIVTG